MNWKNAIPLVLALVLGLTAAVVGRRVLLANRSAAPDKSKMAAVVIVNRDIAPGTELQAADLALGKIPADNVPEHTFTDVESLVGRVTALPMVKSQTVLEPLLAPSGAAGGLQALVPAGMRAITLEVNEFSGVAGLLTPGCRVDVISTFDESQREEMLTRTIVQNLKVTAVGLRTGPATDDETAAAEAGLPKSVTLLATPAEAEQIQLAISTGRPWLVLRGYGDQETSSTSGVTLTELRGAKKRPQQQDPFATPVVEMLTPPAPPSTQPIAESLDGGADEAPRNDTRIVKIIRNTTEDEVVFQIPRQPGQGLWTGNETKPAH